MDTDNTKTVPEIQKNSICKDRDHLLKELDLEISCVVDKICYETIEVCDYNFII